VRLRDLGLSDAQLLDSYISRREEAALKRVSSRRAARSREPLFWCNNGRIFQLDW